VEALFPQPLIMITVFLFGVCIGSFLNVVGLRFLADQSIVNPPSACPHCNKPIEPRDNIPVLSYIILGGKCRHCQAGISVQYPLIELATGVLFCLTVWKFGLGWQTPFLLFLIDNLVVIFITDLRESLIFQINSLSLIPAGLVFHLFNLGHTSATTELALGSFVWHVPEGLISGIIAIAISFVFFEGMILLSSLVFGTEGFGHGDTHLMMGAGAFLGWPLTVLALLLGFVAQTIPAIPILVVQWIRNKQWASLISGAVALGGGLFPVAVMNLPIDISTQTTISLGCIGVSLIALIVFLKQVRNSQNFTYLPLGPALVLGILVALFWGPAILQHLHVG
jgi:leader peptidase (prepilin peptidase)/N-methyltransferase